MNAISLYHADSRPAGVWYCEKCRKVGSSQERAERCCTPPVCLLCGKPVQDRGHSPCTACNLARKQEARRVRIGQAEKLDAWDGWVYWDGHGFQDGYFRDLGELLGYLCDYDDDWPEWVHLCKAKPFKGIHVGDIYENLTEDMDEDATDYLRGTQEFEAAVKAFNEANAHLVTYVPDYKRVVRVPTKAELEAKKQESMRRLEGRLGSDDLG